MDARRSGLVELLLATPLSGREIIRGQLRGLARMFGWPIALYLCVHLIASATAQYYVMKNMSSMFGGGASVLLGGISVGADVLVLIANVAALAWFGMWMGMTSKNASFAALKTLLFVQVIPWCVIWFFSMLIVGFIVAQSATVAAGSSVAVMAPGFATPIISAALLLLKDVGFCIASRARLYHGFRDMAVASVAPIRISTGPPVIPAKN
jgi:hypothetical protein